MVRSTPTSLSPSPSRRARRAQRARSRSPLQDKQSRSPARSPLQEKSSSETNVSNGKDKKPERDVFSSTPFPTKPQHILLPSTIRKQKSFHNLENELPGLFSRAQADGSGQLGALRTLGADAAKKRPVLQLKKSVTTLRDMYEANERSSRPSTATTSPALRPMSSTSRLRSVSSSEGLSGRSAWGSMHKVSSDDLALLPSLNEVTIRKMESQSSFASRMARSQPFTSSPNYRVLGFTSPKMPIFQDEPGFSSDSVEQSSSTANKEVSSTPNFVRLGRSSSVSEFGSAPESSSSPNFVKLGTSSPTQRQHYSPTPSTSSKGSLKRKRELDDDAGSSVAHEPIFDSSPPFVVHAASTSEPRSPESLPFNSSPPEPTVVRSHTATSPLFRIPLRASSESFASSHASLQAALSSSFVPPIQYPVVRAPAPAGQTLAIPKRISRGAQVTGIPFSSSSLSTISSIWEERLPSSGSADSQNDDAGARFVDVNEIGNSSQIRILADDHSQEASDELGALPRPPFRSPPAVPVRTNSLYGTLTSSSASNSQSRLSSIRHSMDSRLNSIRSHSLSRQNSVISNFRRPTSSGSVTNTNLMVPSWARRYYSGVYRDSFQYLYAPSQNGSAAQISIPPRSLRLQRSQSLKISTHESSHDSSTSNRRSLQSFRDSIRQSLTERLPSLFRPNLQARESHLTIGIGPLVSNPTQPEPAMLAADSSPLTVTIRRVSKDKQLSPVDPRAHWAGLTQQGESSAGQPIQQIARHSVEVQQAGRPSGESEGVYYSASAASSGMPSRFRFLPSPHLHRDHRLNTGSSTSRGYGHPFNGKPDYHPARALDNKPDGYGRPNWFSLDLRSTQVVLFVSGFVCPLLWFIAALLPLPARPATYGDVEKAEWDAATSRGTRPVSEWDEIDVVARLRMERYLKGLEEVKWQNARWWRRMNRVMSIVGIVVIVIVVVLVVISTKRGI